MPEETYQDTHEAMLGARFSEMLKEIISTHLVEVIEDKTPDCSKDLPFWKKFINMCFCIMQQDFLGCGDNFKIISFQDLDNVNTFLTDLWDNHRTAFFKSLACDSNGNRLPGEWDGDLEEGFVRCLYYWDRSLETTVKEKRFHEITQDQLTTSVKICVMLELLWTPEPADLFDQNHGIKIMPFASFDHIKRNYGRSDSDSNYSSGASDQEEIGN